MLFTIVAAVGAIVAAVEGNDPVAAVSGIGGVLAALVTLGGRFAQSVVLARQAAAAAGPWIDALQKALESAPPGAVTPPVPAPGESVSVTVSRFDGGSAESEPSQ